MKARAGPPVEKNICDLMEMAGTEKARMSSRAFPCWRCPKVDQALVTSDAWGPFCP
jgi:hypothetical protein